MKTYHLLITGKVQGVYYRASARNEALRLGIAGWVRNTPEGAVEAVATGQEEALQRFISWCGRGPQGALVQAVACEEQEPALFEGFVIRR